MSSYQDIEQRLKSVEDKLGFIMHIITIGQQGPLVGQVTTRTLLQMYHEAKQLSLALEAKIKQLPEVIDGSVESGPEPNPAAV